ncbi:MAG: DUF4384 domain-containing protein [Thermoanaerobaculia bacterium]
MRIAMVTAFAFIVASAPLHAEEKGAKAIFVDSTSGAVINSSAAKPAAAKAKPVARKPVATQAAAPATEVSGLLYYVELVSPTGETSRVTTDRTFTTGERILLHVTSSIDGEIAIYQRTPDGRAEKLFPDDRIRNGSAQIVKGVDTVLPSPTSWFRFDERPGIEELTLVLTPRAAPAPLEESTGPVQMASLRYDEISSASGSKGLVVETDRSGPAQGTYVVRRTVAGRPPAPIVVAVRLKHR